MGCSSRSWPWIRFSENDIISWGFAMQCRIVLPLDERRCWQVYSITHSTPHTVSENTTSQVFLWAQKQGPWPTGCKSMILLHFPPLSSLLNISSYLFMAVTRLIYLAISSPINFFTRIRVTSCCVTKTIYIGLSVWCRDVPSIKAREALLY